MNKKSLLTVACVLLLVTQALTPIARGATDQQSISSLNQAVLSVDGVYLSLSTPILPAPFIEPESDNAAQVATAAKWDNFQEISITAVPFGVKPPTESLPAAKLGMEATYREALVHYRQRQGGSPELGPAATLFDKRVVSSVSVVALNIAGEIPHPVIITEWVVEAGPRIWIVRVSQSVDNPISQNSITSLVQPLAELSLKSPDVFRPSTSIGTSHTIFTPQIVTEPADTLPTPPWWNGDCDTNYYYAHSGGISAYPLGGIYRGAKACGPRPYYGEGPDVLVQFFSGAWGEYEWECVELSMRYLYLAFGIAPYGANGSQVVWNYSGSRLQKIANGTAGKAPQPGDVLSYGSTSTFGHTSVVSTANVDENGNGSITIIEENASPGGSRTHTVSNWQVQDSATVSGWLRDPVATPPAGYTFCVLEGQRCNFSGRMDIAYGANGIYYYQSGIVDGIDCNNATFGDPLPNVQKACYTKLSPDTTPPSISITQQPPSLGSWYASDQTIAFTVSDSGGSGVRGYKLAWDQNPPGGSEIAGASGSVNLSSAGQGQHWLYLQAWDNAGNPSAVQTVGWLGYDTVAPTNPTSVSSGCTASSGVWQNTCADANFTWSGASDATSQVAGYEVYWGTDANGTGALWSPSAAYNPSAVANGTYYLRVHTKDNAGNWSAWTTLFILRYENTAPTGSLQINNDASTTHATLVKLQTTASDAHSGLCQMRLRDAGGAWGAWQGYTTAVYWQLPGPTGQTFGVEIQFQDCAGNLSATYTDTIALNIYPARPASTNYRMVKSTFGASGPSGTSTNYRLNATLGQPSMIGQMNSANYGLASGYWALRPLATIMVTPNPVTLTVGATQTFTASGIDAFGNTIAVNPTWTTDAGTLTGNVLTAQTVSANGRHVTATAGSISGAASVNIIAGSLNSVTVTPRLVMITAGATQAFTASGSDAFGNSVSINPIWNTDAGTMAGGVLTAQTLAANSKHVTATAGNLSDTITFAVVAGSVSHLALTPTVVTLTVGTTQQFTAIGFDVFNNVIPQPTLVWQVTPSDVGVIDDTGWFTAGHKAGVYPDAITVASGSLSISAKVIVRWPYQVHLPIVLR